MYMLTLIFTYLEKTWKCQLYLVFSNYQSQEVNPLKTNPCNSVVVLLPVWMRSVKGSDVRRKSNRYCHRSEELTIHQLSTDLLTLRIHIHLSLPVQFITIILALNCSLYTRTHERHIRNTPSFNFWAGYLHPVYVRDS